MRPLKTILTAVLVLVSMSLMAQNNEANSASVETATQKELQEPMYSDIYLDTVKINTKFITNDYTLVGFNYGVQGNAFMFNPVKDMHFDIQPVYFGITYTKYGKMFGFMPYFGFQTGLFYGHEGFSFKPDKKTGQSDDVDGATKAVMEVVEVPFLSEFHIDGAHFKLIVDAGIYGGYRMNIVRSFPWENDPYTNSFKDSEIRLTYGLKGGAGFAFMLDPIEFHLKAQVKYGWSSLYEPDYASPYYYRYAYPLDVCITAGVHFQLTKRNGKTKKQLKAEAYNNVFGHSK